MCRAACLGPVHSRRRRGSAFERSSNSCATDQLHSDYECQLAGRRWRRAGRSHGRAPRLPAGQGTPAYIIATGIDITERKRLEKAILEISAREQRRIGQDLHDGLGQHLTGIAFMSKVLEQKLEEKSLPRPRMPPKSSSW